MLKMFWLEFYQSLNRELCGNRRVNKTAVILLVLMPVFYTVLFGATYSANVLNNIPLAVCDMQQSKISRMLIKYYDTSDRFCMVEQVNSMEELESSLSEGRAKVGIYIPPDLDSKIKRGVPTEIGMLIDSTNVVYGSAAMIAAKEININLLVGGGQKIVERLGYYADEAMRVVYPAVIRVRIMKNPTNSYTNFMLLGLIGNGVQIALYLYGAAAFAKGRHWRRNPGAALLGKAMGMGVYSLLGFVGSLLIAQELFAVPLRASWLTLLLLGGSFITLFV
ncbi:MAG: ABC transporter permease, partial [Phascolarctobacterium sp.]